MTNLITYTDIALVRPLAQIDVERIDPYIAEAQRYDIMPSVGLETLELCLAVSPDAAHVVLRDGAVYTAPDGAKYECEGLKKALSYYAYKRLVLNNSANVTAFGVVSKLSDNSQPLANSDLRRIANEAEACGKAALTSCIDYMSRNSTLFIEVKKTYKPRQNGLRFKIIGD